MAKKKKKKNGKKKGKKKRLTGKQTDLTKLREGDYVRLTEKPKTHSMRITEFDYVEDDDGNQTDEVDAVVGYHDDDDDGLTEEVSADSIDFFEIVDPPVELELDSLNEKLRFNDDGTIDVGCNHIEKKDTEKVFKQMAKQLGYQLS